MSGITKEIVLIITGAIFLLVGIIGTGINISGVSIPAISFGLRFLSGLIGLILISIGVKDKEKKSEDGNCDERESTSQKKQLENDSKEIPSVLDFSGAWEGKAYDLEHKEEHLEALHKDKVTINIKQSGNDIKAEGHLSTDNRIFNFEMLGTVHGEYITFSYDLISNPVIGYGVMFIHFYPIGKAEGYYLGRRIADDGIVWGKIELERPDPKVHHHPSSQRTSAENTSLRLIKAAEGGNTNATKPEDINLNLITAARNGDDGDIKRLLDKGANIDTRDKDDETPLIWAAKYGQSSSVKLLIKNGVDVNYKKRTSGSNALMIAVAHCQKKAVEELLSSNKVDVNARNGKRPRGEAVLNIAQRKRNEAQNKGNVEQSRKYAEIANLLKQHGATE